MFKKKGGCTDEEILEAFREGAPKKMARGLACLDRDCRPQITAWLARRGIDEGQAGQIYEEAVTDAIVNLCRLGKTLTTNLCGYVFSIARNKWRNEMKHRGKAPEALPETLEEEQPEEQIPPEIIGLCRDLLEEQCRNILDDADDGLSMQEIADKYGYSDARTAKQTKYRCWQKFVGCVKEKLLKEW
ncbi:MAG: sigma-70 family RNA polymerase sigma factor [Phaeodactylibacter sp.]|nr:sigma-70 family RNA polymerase sigma factor [Phaeodactylibacter sp.]